MKARLYIALCLAVILMPLLAQARHIKVYTFNRPSRKQQPAKPNCLDSLPLGCVSFKSTQTWTVVSGDTIRQEWSDVVMATGCKKNYYEGGDLGNFKADCRQNEGYGDWFSWEMVNRYHKKLCPNGWRLPALADFVALNIALGGSGADSEDETLRDRYLNVWGGAYNGLCEYADEYEENFLHQGVAAYYWALLSDELQPNFAHSLFFYSGDESIYKVHLHITRLKDLGMAVRCVK